jgi:hypothetical protein
MAGVIAGCLEKDPARRRQKKTRWEQVGQRLSNTSGELADAVGDILSHVKVIYEEGRKVAEDAGALWAHGRKLAGH